MSFSPTQPAGSNNVSDLDTILAAQWAVLKYRSLFWGSAYPSVANDIGLKYTMPYDGTFSKAWLNLVTVNTGADFIVDIKKNGTTIWTNVGNRVKITAGASPAQGNTTTFDVTSFVAGDVISCDIKQVGATIVGAGLTVQLDIIHA
jgi:hypothetical protein